MSVILAPPPGPSAGPGGDDGPFLNFGAQVRFLREEWRAAFLTPKNWPADFMSAIAVALVALPLSLAIARASGVPPHIGLVTAIVGGIVVALFGGSRLQVSGPAAAMTFLVYEVITKFETLGREHYQLNADDAAKMGLTAVIVCTLGCGVLQVISGIFRAGRLMQFFPRPVINGFLAGIGVTIFSTQLPVVLGYDVPHDEEGGAAALLWNTIQGIGQTKMPSLLVGATAVALMLGLPKVSRRLPTPLIAVVAASLLPMAFSWSGEEIKLLGALPRSFPTPGLPSWTLIPIQHFNELVMATLTFWFLTSIESLLSASVVDSLARGRRTDHDQELFGQGLGNVASGLFGGIPVTGVIARSATNVQSGARTRLSAILHAFIILVMMLALAPVVGRIPVAALAGVLVAVATRMIEWRMLVFLWKTSKLEAGVFLVTAGAIVFTDLVVGVIVGLAAALLFLVIEMSRLQVRTEDLGAGQTRVADLAGEDEHPWEIQVMRVEGALFFGTGYHLLNLVTNVKARFLIIDLEKVSFLDLTGAEILEEAVEAANRRKTEVVFAGVVPQVKERFEAMFRTQKEFEALRAVPIYEKVRDAMLHAASLLEVRPGKAGDPLKGYPALKQALEEASHTPGSAVAPRVRAVIGGEGQQWTVSSEAIEGDKPSYLSDESIRPSPPAAWHDRTSRPAIHPTAFVDPRATVIGAVTIAEKVYVGPNTSIRADEGTPFYIGADSNIQDGVTFHALKDKVVMVQGRPYAIYVGKGACCTHGCIIHGPSFLGDKSFIGFGAMVHNSVIGSGCVLGLGAIVVGVTLSENRYVPHNYVVDTQEKADKLPAAEEPWTSLRADVVEVNTHLAEVHMESHAGEGDGTAKA